MTGQPALLRPLSAYQNLTTAEFIAELGYDIMLAEYGVSNVTAEPDGTLTRQPARHDRSTT